MSMADLLRGVCAPVYGLAPARVQRHRGMGEVTTPGGNAALMGAIACDGLTRFRDRSFACKMRLLKRDHRAMRHVVVVVLDGLRRDLIGEDRTPALARFAQRSQSFASHSSVFPSATRVVS